ncbi:MAG: flagellar basal body rod protein [Geobacter sp.]|nr:flagellar basal body rod protein [Geobacter sp.]
MTDATSIASSALDAYTTKIEVTAHNVANTNTENFKPTRVTLQETQSGGVSAAVRPTDDQVDISREAVEMLSTVNGYKANLQAIKTDTEMAQSMLDIIS